MKYPLLCAYVVTDGARLRARTPRSSVEVRVEGIPVRRLLSLCDGTRPASEIAASLASLVDAGSLAKFMRTLERLGVVCDAESYMASQWRFVENPRLIGAEADPALVESLPRRAAEAARARPAGIYRAPARSRTLVLLGKRRSIRRFSGARVPLRQTLTILAAAYGCTTPRGASAIAGPTVPRTVPSAGALYPLRFGLVNLRTVSGLSAGLYDVHFADDGRVGLMRRPGDADDVLRSFAKPLDLFGAQGVIVVFAEAAATASKYGNRSVLYVALEAGHAIQAAMLAATELSIGHVEIGGFCEDGMRRLFARETGTLVLSSLVFGAALADSADTPEHAPIACSWLDTEGAEYSPPFHIALADVPVGDDSIIAWGRDAHPRRAVTKAVAESVERLACTRPRDLHVGRLADFGNAIDPRAIVAYADQQYARGSFPFKPFADRTPYAWVECVDELTGKSRLVLADCVYFLADLRTTGRRRPYTASTTSGVAAFPTRAGAIERAVLELLERHAFMQAWYFPAAHPTITRRGLPHAIVARIGRLQRTGTRMQVRMLLTDPAYVVLVIASNDRRAFTHVTAAASFDAEQAVEHALEEMELHILERMMRDPTPVPMALSRVRSPPDHAALYAQRQHFRKADFLATSSTTMGLPGGRGARRRMADIRAWVHGRGSELLIADLGPASAGPVGTLHVVRALIPGTIPIHFGFGLEPLGLLKSCSGEPVALRHLRTKGGLLPHPFN